MKAQGGELVGVHFTWQRVMQIELAEILEVGPDDMASDQNGEEQEIVTQTEEPVSIDVLWKRIAQMELALRVLADLARQEYGHRPIHEICQDHMEGYLTAAEIRAARELEETGYLRPRGEDE